MQEQLVPAKLRQAKEKTHNDSKSDERGENCHAFKQLFVHIFTALFSIIFFCMICNSIFILTMSHSLAPGDVPAGRPSNREEQRRPSFAGRFSSYRQQIFFVLITKLSPLNASSILIYSSYLITGRRSRRNSFSEDSQLTIENFGGSQDQLNMIGTIDRRSQDRERKISNASTIEQAVPVRSTLADARGSIQIGYDSDVEKEDRETEKPQLKRQNSNTSSSNSSGVQLERKMASFASLTPSTTTWQQQSLNTNQLNEIRALPFRK